MASAAPEASRQDKAPSEDIIARKTDLCISNAIVKTGVGFATGVVLSVLLFKRRAFPIFLSTGFGLGSAYTDCERSFNPYSIPGQRILPPPTNAPSSSSSKSSPSSSSSSSQLGESTILERLGQRAGEAVDTAKVKAKPAVDEIKDQYGFAKEKVETKGREVKSEVEKKIRQV